jgi:hypothetical protein
VTFLLVFSSDIDDVKGLFQAESNAVSEEEKRKIERDKIRESLMSTPQQQRNSHIFLIDDYYLNYALNSN